MRVEWELFWVALAATVPLVPALLVAWPLWRRKVKDHMGAISGAGVVLVAAVAFIAREYGEVEKITARCRELDVGCHFHPDPFYRYAAFGALAMAHIAVLFSVELVIEERRREREDYAPAWRR